MKFMQPGLDQRVVNHALEELNVSGAFPSQKGGSDRSTSLSDRPITREKWADNGAEF